MEPQVPRVHIHSAAQDRDRSAVEGKFKKRVREITKRNRGSSLDRVIRELRSYLLGWRGYFGFCQTRSTLFTQFYGRRAVITHFGHDGGRKLELSPAEVFAAAVTVIAFSLYFVWVAS